MRSSNRKIRLSNLALQLAETKSLDQLATVASAGQEILKLTSSTSESSSQGVGPSSDLEAQIRRLYANHLDELSQQDRLARLNRDLSLNLQAISRRITNLVGQLETTANQRTTASLDALASGARDQKATADAGLKELLAKMDGTVKSVTAALQARGGTYELMLLEAELKGTSDSAIAGRIRSDMTLSFDNTLKRLSDLPAAKKTAVESQLKSVRDQILGSNGILALVGSNLTARARAIVETDANDRALDSELQTRFEAVGRTMTSLNRFLLSVVDDAVFDSTLEVQDAAAGLTRQIGAASDRFMAGGKSVAETLSSAGQKTKAALVIQLEYLTISSLVQKVELAGDADAVGQSERALGALFDQARHESEVLGSSGSSELGAGLALLREQILGKDGFVPAKLRLLAAHGAFDQDWAECQKLVAATDRKVIAQAQSLKADAARQTELTVASAQRAERGMLIVAGSVVVISLAMGLFVPRAIVTVLKHIIAELSQGASRLGLAARQVSGASGTLAEGASHQATAIAQTSDSIEQISTMTQRNAENAQTAKVLANQTRAAAESGVKDMGEMSQAMVAIKAWPTTSGGSSGPSMKSPSKRISWP